MSTPTRVTPLSDKPKLPWWSFFKRAEFSRQRPSRPAHHQLVIEAQDEGRQLVEVLGQASKRLETAAEPTDFRMEIDPMPVIAGIQHIHQGQQELSTTLTSLNQMVERSSQTDERLTGVIARVNETLTNVRTTQVETIRVMVDVGEKIEEVTERFEILFESMSENEQATAAAYRRFQSRTLVAVAGIAALVVVTLGLFMVNPWS